MSRHYRQPPRGSLSPMSALVLHRQWERMLWMPHKCLGSQAQLQEWGQDPGGERGIHLGQLHTID